MKEFIEKLIGRLEVNSFPLTFNFETESYLKYNKVKEIVNELAEEYKDKDCSKCSRRSWYQIGYADAEKKFAEEYNNDFCEWEYMSSVSHYANIGCKNVERNIKSMRYYTYCPYCGKRIKVVEVEGE